MTQEQLAKFLEKSQKRISQFENQITNPDIQETNRLMKIFNCSFYDIYVDECEEQLDNNKNILIHYVLLEGHADPNFTFLGYGDSGKRGTRLNTILEVGSYVFFKTNIGNKHYITGYFKVSKKLLKGRDDIEINNLNCDAKCDDVVIIGDRNESKILTSPLLFDKSLVLQLHSLKFSEDLFTEDDTEVQTIARRTREHRALSNNDTQFLIDKCHDRG